MQGRSGGCKSRYSGKIINGWCLLAAFFVVGCGGGGSSDAPDAGDDPETGSATLTWQAPATDQGGGPLTGLAGYRVYYGQTPRNGDDPNACGDDCGYTGSQNVGLVTSATIDPLDHGTWYFSVTALDPAGNESVFSEEESKTIP
jgi:hypothetical protein